MNYTLIQPNITDLGGYFQYVNVVSGGYYGLGLTFAIGAIVLFSLLPFAREKAFLAATVFGTITAMFLSFLNILNPIYILLWLVFLVIAVLIQIRENSKGN